MTDKQTSILSVRQRTLLDLLSLNRDIHNHFYLSGGTALAEYYLHHRYSEDLDFFSEQEVDTASIQILFKTLSTKIGIQKVDFQHSFNRNLFFLHFEKEIIKTEFTYYPFAQSESPKVINGLKVDSLLDIAINKTFTIYQQPKSRHFIDLYLTIREIGIPFSELRKKARIKFDTHMDPLQMAQQLLEVDTITDLPRLIVPLEDKVWKEFWRKEADALKNEVLR